MLGCAVAEELYARFPGLPEGKLTRLRASLVREETLADVGARIGLGDYLRLGRVNIQPSLIANALEAVLGAVFLDAGYDAARGAVRAAFGPLLDELDPETRATKDPKTQLQEILQARQHGLPEYRVVGVQGAAHRQSFEVECVVQELGLRATGTGSSRQRAEQEAATGLLRQLNP